MSENIGRYKAGNYLVTAAIWRPHLAYANGQVDTYEIGIREKTTGKFWLFQSDLNHQTVQEVASAIALLLGSMTENYSPEWCMEHFK